MVFPADDKNLPDVLEFIGRCLDSISCPNKARIQIGISVEEVFVNISHYAYDKPGGSVTVNVEATPGMAVITLIDTGFPFDPLKKTDPDITLSLEERPIGGLGVFMAKNLMDEMTYEYKDGQNILTMRKHL